MIVDILGRCAIVILALCCGECRGAAQQPVDYDFPTVLPIWIVEDDPATTIFSRKDLERDRKVGKILVIPLYMDYGHDGKIDHLAIAHSVIYTPGQEIEQQLASFGERENLRRLIAWAPGYFPGRIGRVFDWVPVINGKKMIVLEMQPCVGSEDGQINEAMKTLLVGGDFVIEKWWTWEKRPPYSNDPTWVNEPYDIRQVVRSEEYEERYFKYGGASCHGLWGFAAGTRIANRLSADEKEMVATFAAQTAGRQGQGASAKGGGSAK
jgi:hypothetical protein